MPTINTLLSLFALHLNLTKVIRASLSAALVVMFGVMQSTVAQAAAPPNKSPGKPLVLAPAKAFTAPVQALHKPVLAPQFIGTGPCFATHDDGVTVFDTVNADAVQQAMDAASAGGTVKVAGTCAGVQTRAGTNQTVYISKTITLQGGFTTTNWSTSDPIGNPTTLDALTQGRVIYATAALTMSSLTAQNGNTTGAGGGAYFGSAAILSNTQFLSNTASGAGIGTGGGAHVVGPATFNGGVFQNNQSSVHGGGLYALNTLTLTGTLFLSNTASGLGGGVIVYEAATLNGGLFQNNTSTNNSNNGGGGLYANNILALTGTQFVSNTATGSGGGIFAAGRARLNGGLFQNNHSTTKAGGGLYALGTLAMTDTQFISNTASNNGGGAYTFFAATLSGGLFQNNRSTDNGGGLFAFNTLAMTGAQFISNTASTNGGGAFTSSNATITASTFMSNSSGSTAGGLFHSAGTLTLIGSTFTANSTDAFGGGLNVANASTVIVTGSTFERNTAANGGGIVVAGNAFLSVTASTFAGNQAGTDIGYLGGGLYNFGRANIANSTFAGNTANTGGGLGNGGVMTLTNSTIAANTAITGAGIANDPDLAASAILLRNSLIASQTTGTNCSSLTGTLTADAFNIADDATCNAATQKATAQIALGPLANNGGGTKTMALGANSAALEAGDNAVCAEAPVNSLDQRGVTRPQVLRCDVGAFELQWTNNAPIANAGTPQSALLNSLVTLNGSGSSDPDGHSLTYGWSQVSGTGVTLSSNSAISPTFTTPAITDTLVFQLIVTDAFGAVSAPAFVTVTVQFSLVTLVPPSGLVLTATGGTANQPLVEFNYTLAAGTEPIIYTWDFGDGTPIYSGTTASHTYAPGAYTATLTATNSAGAVAATTRIVVPWRVLLPITVQNFTPPAWQQQR